MLESLKSDSEQAVGAKEGGDMGLGRATDEKRVKFVGCCTFYVQDALHVVSSSLVVEFVCAHFVANMGKGCRRNEGHA